MSIVVTAFVIQLSIAIVAFVLREEVRCLHACSVNYFEHILNSNLVRALFTDELSLAVYKTDGRLGPTSRSLLVIGETLTLVSSCVDN